MKKIKSNAISIDQLARMVQAGFEQTATKQDVAILRSDIKEIVSLRGYTRRNPELAY